MTAQAVSAREALVEVTKEGDRMVGYITNAWFRYLVNAGSVVDLASAVSGVLPTTNGGSGTAPTRISVTGVATTLVPDGALFFVIQDTTSGGMSVGVMDPGGVVIPAAFAGIAGITFSRLAGSGLQAIVTAGVSPRALNIFALSIGAP